MYLLLYFPQICKPPASSWAPVGAGSYPGDKALFWHAAHHGVLQAGEGGIQGGCAGVLGQRRLMNTFITKQHFKEFGYFEGFEASI